MNNLIWKILSDAAEKWPDKTAVVCKNKHSTCQCFTYQQTKDRAMALGSFLINNNIKPKTTVAVIDVNSANYFETYFAAAHCGAILCPINYRLSKNEIAAILSDSQTTLLIASTKFKDKVLSALKVLSTLKQNAAQGFKTIEKIIWIKDTDNIDQTVEFVQIESVQFEDALENCGTIHSPVSVDATDVVHLYYTSGTTGKPKGVMLTGKNVYLHSKAATQELRLDHTDIWGHIAPMFHLADAWATFAISMVGGRHVMNGSFEAKKTLDLIQEEKITISNLIPTMLNLMTRHSFVTKCDCSSLRVILSGGAPIAVDVVKRIMNTFNCDYIQTYGMTETSPYLTLSILHPHLQKLPADQRLKYKAKTGRPFKTVQLKVVDKLENLVLPNDKQVGEIWVCGETITPGYWNKPEETAASFSGQWLKTGDLAVLDNEGYINIVDRKKDMIITGGENVYSTEVENILYQHAKILEAAVFGIADEKWGEAVCAALVSRTGQTIIPSEVVEFCKQHLAGYKVPKRVIILKQLPKTGTGKISKKELRNFHLK